jgi:S1-C subfamily serine protease
VQIDDPERQQSMAPRRRLRTRFVVAALIAVVAAVTAARLEFTKAEPHRVGTGVVIIETNLGYANSQAAGTGMVLTSSGEVLTNNHVIRGATDIRVKLPSGRSYPAQVVGYSESDDVALLQLTGAENLKTVSLASSSGVKAGQPVRAVGNAGGTGYLSVATGTVTNLNRSITVGDDQGGSEHLIGMIETNAAVRPGDSGGPLLNADGEVIGMDTAASVSNDVAQTTTNQGFAIPIDRATSITDQIHSGNASATVHVGGTAFLGIEATGNSYDGSGAVVSAVVPGSAAEAAGISAGDLIMAVGGQAISSPDALGAIVVAQKPGAVVEVVYVDQTGMTQSTNLTLASGPPR